jgi:hypothetical protein
MFLFVSVKTSLATNIKQCFQGRPLVVCKTRRSPVGDCCVATFSNILFYSLIGGGVAIALTRLTIELGGGVIAFVERLFG